MTSLQEIVAIFSDTVKEISDLKTENTDLKAKLEAVSNLNSILEVSFESFKVENASLKTQIKTLTNRSTGLMKQNRILKENFARKSNQADAGDALLKSAHESLTAATLELQGSHLGLRKQRAQRDSQ